MAYNTRERDYQDYRKKANVFYKQVDYTIDSDWLEVGDPVQVSYYRASTASPNRLGLFHIHGFLTKSAPTTFFSGVQNILTIDISNAEPATLERTFVKYGTIRANADLNFTSTEHTSKVINMVARLSYLPLSSTTTVALDYIGILNGDLWATQGLVSVEVSSIYLDLYL